MQTTRNPRISGAVESNSLLSLSQFLAKIDEIVDLCMKGEIDDPRLIEPTASNVTKLPATPVIAPGRYVGLNEAFFDPHCRQKPEQSHRWQIRLRDGSAVVDYLEAELQQASGEVQLMAFWAVNSKPVLYVYPEEK